MTTILVVDDAAVDRRLVGELLAEEADLQVEYAVHGAEALDCMAQSVPDLVLTDLIMPEMDGLELVAAVRKEYPLVPVILMTSKGSEEIAVRALQQGAASYVSKRTLPDKLLRTIRRVLTVASHRRTHSRLMQCMAESRCSFVLENDAGLFVPLVTQLQETVAQFELCDETERTRIGVALEEALANSLYHGNLEVGSGKDEKYGEEFFTLAAQRTQEPPYTDRRIYVEATVSRHRAVFTVRDGGRGFDPSELPDPTDPENLERVSGRGVLLMRTFMDEVTYNDVGNSVTMVKYRDSNVEPIDSEEA